MVQESFVAFDTAKLLKKIMFNDKYGLTQAVLDGIKTQTRRIVSQKKLDKISLFQEEYYDMTFDKLEGIELLTHYFFTEKLGRLPYNVGEVVAVAQSYETSWKENASAYHNPYFLRGLPGWKNKMFVAARDMLHQIRITDVRVERLQEISDEDCLKEGVIKWDAGQKDIPFFSYPNSAKCDYDTPQEAFANLINKVSRKDVWQENPYVFVYDFELLK